MKYFVALFLVLSTVLRCDQLPASQHEWLVASTWVHEENDLVLSVAFPKELELSGKASAIRSENKVEQGFEFFLKPVQSGIFLSSEGYELKTVALRVKVRNLPNPNKIFYTITREEFYTKPYLIFLSTTFQGTEKGMLINPAIDLTEDPVMTKTDDEFPQVEIRFKNSFPCSQVQ